VTLIAVALFSTGPLLMPAGAPAAGAPATSAKKKPHSCANSNLLPNKINTAAVAAATLCLIDKVRATYHLRPLRSNHELQALATTQVGDMVRWNYFADNRPAGQTPATLIEATRYGAHATRLATGQNIAWGTGVYASPARVVTAWMNSPPHRKIILTADFRDAGVSATAAVPSVVENRVPTPVPASMPGATYAVEFGARG
jgi:uncharacterized protein YkwD